MNQKKKMTTSNKIILTSVIFTTIFTIVAIVMQFVTLQEMSPTLTTCVFGYWAVELGSLAMIRRKKLDVGYQSEEKFYEEEIIEEGVED